MPFVRSSFFILLGALAVAGLASPGPAAKAGDDAPIAPLLEGIGPLHHPVKGLSPEAQRYFNQGLTLHYAFNHLESVRSFEEVIRRHPDNAMAHWGIALTLGPNINDSLPDAERERRTFEEIRRARALAGTASKKERDMIEALAARHSGDEEVDRDALNEAYAAKMEALAERYQEDSDIQVLYAAALMNTTPWDYWVANGQEPKPITEKFLVALEGAIERDPDHPGAHHYYIHAVEASSDPDRGVPSATKLETLVPVAGHLVHMPSHIWIRVGRYADAAATNVAAVAADEDYVTQCRAQGLYPVTYYPHNIHFLWAARTMQGRSKDAMDAAYKVATKHKHEHMDEPGFGFPHLLSSLSLFAQTRFGDWDGVLAEPAPAEKMKFKRGARHFARGMAFRARGELDRARTELAALKELAKDPDVVALTVWELNSLGEMLEIGAYMLAGEIASAEGDHGRAEAALCEAVRIEDGLLYNEPADWPQPARHSLGAVLLAAERFEAAERVYKEDLKRHRDNGWSLRGLITSLEGQGKHKEAAEARKRFEQAWSEADVEITSSRF